MKQRDIERVMAAAWVVENELTWRTAGVAALCRLLLEIDPHGLYRAGAPRAPFHGEADEPTLRQSPKL